MKESVAKSKRFAEVLRDQLQLQLSALEQMAAPELTISRSIAGAKVRIDNAIVDVVPWVSAGIALAASRLDGELRVETEDSGVAVLYSVFKGDRLVGSLEMYTPPRGSQTQGFRFHLVSGEERPS